MVNLVLLGRTGNGKRSTGNSILGENVFNVRSNLGVNDAAAVDGTRGGVNVVNCWCVGDTGDDMAVGIKATEDSGEMALESCGDKINMFVLVLKYGVRFTKQEKDAVERVKKVFGQDVLRNWGVMVMTYGDNFQLDAEDSDLSFESWLKEQRGDIQHLLEEMKYRCVLFDNKTRDEVRRREQREKLMSFVKQLPAGRPYSGEDFKRAGPARDEMIRSVQIDEFKVVVRKLIDDIKRSLDRHDTTKDQLVTFVKQLNEAEEKIIHEFGSSRSLYSELMDIRHLQKRIKALNDEGLVFVVIIFVLNILCRAYRSLLNIMPKVPRRVLNVMSRAYSLIATCFIIPLDSMTYVILVLYPYGPSVIRKPVTNFLQHVYICTIKVVPDDVWRIHKVKQFFERRMEYMD
ncbi:uncharacterized protein LOC131952111 [Physella acuta]|uniref:uncharacterized protein LOC131952111 n=1 Tax=Physella acuta TaxID=109671 RepID=UPI0027DB9BB6|nr:uncharacterized protein LOC131952111 [Physella acuta]XP_059170614.1 uncharacterized protein LOC131952111 [Physella acuta]